MLGGNLIEPRFKFRIQQHRVKESTDGKGAKTNGLGLVIG